MSVGEQYLHLEIVGISLRLGTTALSILHTTPEDMATPDAPDIALIEIGEDIYTLGGTKLEAIAAWRGAPLLPHREIDVSNASRSEVYDSVRLLLGKSSLEALTASVTEMNAYCPPTFALVSFGDVWRMGGDVIADYVSERGCQVVYGNNLDEQGYDITGENSFN